MFYMIDHLLANVHRDLLSAMYSLRHAATPAQIAAAAARAAAAVSKGVGGSKGTEALLAELRKKREVVLSSGDKAALKSGLTSYMRSLQRCPAKVRTFFQAPTVRYAA